MSCQVGRDSNGNITLVESSIGKESILFEELLSFPEAKSDKETALRAWAQVYTAPFKQWFGDWERDASNASKAVDSNGEPLVVSGSIHVRTGKGHEVVEIGPSFLNTRVAISEDRKAFPGDSVFEADQIRPAFNQSVVPEKPGQLKEKISNFLSAIGVSIEVVDALTDRNGNKIDDVSAAYMLDRVIKVVRGTADSSTLPEETAHFFVELLGTENPLYKDMFKAVTGYKLYQQIVQEYKNDPEYRNSDGTIRFDKIKKEVIGKMIAAHMTGRVMENESSEKIVAWHKWWEKLWNYVVNIFKDIKVNPFEQAADQILSGNTAGLKDIGELNDNEIYFQKSNSYSKIKADQQRILVDNSIDPATSRKRRQYTVNGKDIKGTVTEFEVDKWYKNMFPSDSRTSRQKNIQNLIAQEGDNIHAEAKAIIERYIDADTGELRAVPHPPAAFITNQAVYNRLEDYLSELLRSYPIGTKFMAEVRVYDSKKDIADSIDLLVLREDGSADIFDWKTQEIEDGQTDQIWHKEQAYRIRLEASRRIVAQEYGITKFNKVRAIPFKAEIIYKEDQNAVLSSGLIDIEIGNLDPRLTPKEKSYLLPVVVRNESTGDEQMDQLIDQLNRVYEKVLNKNVAGKQKYIQSAELKKIKDAIRDLQVRKEIGGFVKNGRGRLMNYRDKLDNDTITEPEVLEAVEILEIYANAQSLLREEVKRLEKEIASQTDPEQKLAGQKLLRSFSKMSRDSKSTLFDMKDRLKQMAVQIGEKEGIRNFLAAERSMDKLKLLFRSVSTLPTKGIQAFYKLLSTAQSKRDFSIERLNEKLAYQKDELVKWAASRGIDALKMFDSILKFDGKGNWTGDFLDQYSKEYFDQRDKALENGDKQWMAANTVFDRQRYEEDLKHYTEVINSMVYSSDPVENQKLQEAALASWTAARDIDKADAALINKKNTYLKPTDKWFSKEWLALLRPENTPLKKAFDLFQEIKLHSDKLGMIDYMNGFIPSIRQDKLEMAAFNGLTNVFNLKGFFEGLEVDSDKYFGETDPLTGELIKKIPVKFLNDLGKVGEDGTVDYSLKSKDLFKVFSIWGSHMYNYEAMQEIKDSGEVLVAVEKTKNSLATNVFGKVTPGRKENVGNEVNADALEKFVNYYVYGQSVGGNSDYAIKIGDKEYSAVQTGRAMIRYLSIKTLALNILSGTATFVGGTGNAFFQASKGQFFTVGDWGRGWRDFTGRDPKAIAALAYFDVGLEDAKGSHSNRLSVSAAVREMTMEKLFFIQRNGDKAVQYPVALTMMRTHMVVGDKIVDINAFVKEKYNYDATFYQLPAAERKQMKEKIDAEVKELKATKSLRAIAEIKNDELHFPGLDRDSRAVYDFRNKIRKVNKSIIGNATHEDINLIRVSLLGQALMQFRSWMPQMVTERFGDLSYDTDLDTYQYGKSRLFLKHLFNKKVFPLIGELVTGLGTNTIDRAKERYVEMKIRMEERGEDFNMSEAEFIDMYLGNIRSQLRELVVLSNFLAIVFWAKSGDDRDKQGFRKLLARAMEKYQGEFSFFYSPLEFTNTIKNPLPVVGLLNDFRKLGTQTIGQIYGFAIQDDELMEKMHPLKYWGKLLPITKEAIEMYGMFDDDFRKSWGLSNNY
jgi:hypothetical protein